MQNSSVSVSSGYSVMMVMAAEMCQLCKPNITIAQFQDVISNLSDDVITKSDSNVLEVRPVSN